MTATSPGLFDEIDTVAADTCHVEGCSDPIRRKRDGLCNRHRCRADRGGDLTRPGRKENERAKVEITARVQSPDAYQSGECWLWPLARNARGYGLWYAADGYSIATRVVYELAFGRAVADAESVCHRCDTPACYRPSHLFLGNAFDNMRDAAAKRRFPNRTGERNSQAKLTDAQATELRAALDEGLPMDAAAKRFGISPRQVGRIRDGERGKPTYLGQRGTTPNVHTLRPIPPEAVR